MGKSNSRSWITNQIGGMPVWGIIASAVFLAGVGVFAVTNLPDSTSASVQSGIAGGSAPSPAQEPLTISVVGDSNTEANSDDFSAGRIGSASWVAQVVGNGATFRGGWADGGTTSITQSQNLSQLERANALLILTGTNDLAQGVSFDQTRTAIDTMVAKAPADRVVLLAIPPRDEEYRRTTTEFNADLQKLAEERGWDFYDGLGFVRDTNGGFAQGTTVDGTHLTGDAQRTFGQEVLRFLGLDT